ncbi:unnamed protein product [Litomosoides sigmodontis]|uniref:Uncharacterized protein n=1 Tax=Litomosoides sigmodontis TaxID=42156 RepID=A0A3P6SSX8_LITSI|nr:unnamed protein product [Litomosoides sigmodontis]
MTNRTTIKFAIGAFATIAASLILLYHFRRKRKKTRRTSSLEKQIKSTERLLPKKGRIQIARRTKLSKHAAHTKKPNDSKKKYTTPGETFGDSSTKQNKSEGSVGVTKSFKTMETTSPTSVITEKDRSQYSSENYPLAVTWKRKELIDSYCYCGQNVTVSSNATGELNESCKVQLLPTIVKPVSFDPYSPEDFTQAEGASDEMSKNSMQMTATPKNHRIIVPFLPILHAITYASKHAELLQELLQNYEYYESQFT